MDIKSVFGYEGKNVVVTGAASGMGKAATEFLISLGAKVHAVDINPVDLPVEKAYIANLGEKESIEKLVSELPDSIFAFFSCQGISHFPGIELKVSKVNFLGHKYMTELLLPKIEDNGSVNFISSFGGFGWEQDYARCLDLIKTKTWDEGIEWYENNKDAYISADDNSACDYTFSKKCLNSYVSCKAHAPEFIGRRIRINAICPGYTITGLSDDFNRSTGNGDAEAGQKVIENMFLGSWNGRPASAQEMGYPLAVLGSKICSYISGQIIYIDYGLSTQFKHMALSANL